MSIYQIIVNRHMFWVFPMNHLCISWQNVGLHLCRHILKRGELKSLKKKARLEYKRRLHISVIIVVELEVRFLLRSVIQVCIKLKHTPKLRSNWCAWNVWFPAQRDCWMTHTGALLLLSHTQFVTHTIRAPWYALIRSWMTFQLYTVFVIYCASKLHAFQCSLDAQLMTSTV